MAFQLRPSQSVSGIHADQAARTVSIDAVPEGFGAAILRILGLGGKSRLTADVTGVRLSEFQFTGEHRTYCPLRNVAASVFIRARATGLLVIAGVLFPVAAPMLLESDTRVPALILVGIMVTLCIAFLLAKQRVTIGVITNATTVESLKLKASSEEIRKLEAVAAVIESLLLGEAGAQHESASDWDSGLDPTASKDQTRSPATDASSTFSFRCSNCDSHLRLKSSWRGKTIICPACQQKQFVSHK